ncbi:MAG: DNA polymerase III delta prime subunit [Candidatus Carbobacillus altaicus]|uniref:DNA polymerase III delta prime subunit n=1 Tax=Candidatus Carbonibacillus altaicus TaxID=2163959 RepID=A0A2R6Y250_9BACL|nr:MAG: DNA polymerase III delta prime subunit [Candidatus Carbobacillus altaicus]
MASDISGLDGEHLDTNKESIEKESTEREWSYTARIDQLFASGRWVHGYIFAGPPGSQKKEAARYMAARLLGTEDVIQAGAIWYHPDLFWVDAPDTSHKVEDTRLWMQNLLLAPVKSNRRVLIVEGAERLTREAQNSFLKFLEEPPSGRIIILLSEEPWRLLPTVRSRLLTMVFWQKDLSEVKRKLLESGVRAEDVETLAPFYADAERAEMIARHPSFASLRESVVDWICAHDERKDRDSDPGGLTVYRWLMHPLVKDEPELLFQLVLAALKDMLRLVQKDAGGRTSRHEWHYPDYLERLRQAAHTMGIRSISDMIFSLLMGWEAYTRAHTLFPIESVLWNLDQEERLTWAWML